jgi:hypothetical protein
VLDRKPDAPLVKVGDVAIAPTYMSRLDNRRDVFTADLETRRPNVVIRPADLLRLF